MSTMLVELHDALKDSGASGAEGRAPRPRVWSSAMIASSASSNRPGSCPSIQDQIDRAREDIVRLDKELAVIRAQIDLLKWMNGIVIAGVLALIIKTFFG